MNFLTSLLLLTPALALPAPQDPVPMPSPVPTPTSSTPSSSASSSPSASASGDLTCSQKSMAFEGWDLTSFSLTNTTRRPSPSTGPFSESELRFTVESSVLGYNVECRAMVEDGAGGNGGGAGNGTATASGTKGLLGLIQAAGAGDGAFDGAHEFRCEPPADVEQDGTVLFSFDAESGELYMKQKWVCHDDPMWPAYYTGTGNATAELDCTEGEDEINEDWEADGGEDYATRTTECAAEEVSAELEQIEAIA